MFLEKGSCDACGAHLGKVKLHMPVYCIPCIEEMEKLNMSPNRYKKYKVAVSRALH